MGLFRYKRYVHPVRTAKRSAKRAVTPKPIRKVRRAATQITHPGSTLSGAAKAELSRSLKSKPKRRAGRRGPKVSTARSHQPPTPVIPRPRRTLRRTRPRLPVQRWRGIPAIAFPPSIFALALAASAANGGKSTGFVGGLAAFVFLGALVLAVVIAVKWWRRRKRARAQHEAATVETIMTYVDANPAETLSWIRARIETFGMESADETANRL